VILVGTVVLAVAMALSKPPPPATSMFYSFLLFVALLSLQQMYAPLLASTKLLTIVGGFSGSILFLLSLTFLGNIQESMGMRTGWAAVIFSMLIAATAAAFVHGVSFTTCIIFSSGILYEMTKVSTVAHHAPETAKVTTGKGKKHK
jgi:apolipoprotein N-acyltransferase